MSSQQNKEWKKSLAYTLRKQLQNKTPKTWTLTPVIAQGSAKKGQEAAEKGLGLLPMAQGL